jgi:hypothetical protein
VAPANSWESTERTLASGDFESRQRVLEDKGPYESLKEKVKK